MCILLALILQLEWMAVSGCTAQECFASSAPSIAPLTYEQDVTVLVKCHIACTETVGYSR